MDKIGNHNDYTFSGKELSELDNADLSQIRIYGCISTYDTFIGNGQVIIDTIEEFHDKIVKPLDKDLTYRLKGKKIEDNIYRFDSGDWNKTKLLILNDRVEEIILRHTDKTSNENISVLDSTRMSKRFIGFNILTEAQYPEEASLIEFFVTLLLYKTHVPNYVSNAFVSIIETLTNSISSAGGYITIDCPRELRAFSAHERYVGLTYMSASRQFDKYFRGYSWGNFLSKKHVELLGGINLIEKEAPVYLVKKLQDGGAFLQLTEDINNVSDDDLRKLKRFFQPILPKAPICLFPSEATFRRMIIDNDDEKYYLNP